MKVAHFDKRCFSSLQMKHLPSLFFIASSSPGLLSRGDTLAEDGAGVAVALCDVLTWLMVEVCDVVDFALLDFPSDFGCFDVAADSGAKTFFVSSFVNALADTQSSKSRTFDVTSGFLCFFKFHFSLRLAGNFASRTIIVTRLLRTST